ncbi:hypothetical protein KY285_006410 [Solanum tuberosum]|nr:hypothetical protein KY284_005451 [Solanum tuberosum]KAH0753262.1 hypothetical protein KY285_006410 [Solanum tuberosum]
MDDSRFIARMDPALLVRHGEYIDGVFVIDAAALFRTNRHLSQTPTVREIRLRVQELLLEITWLHLITTRETRSDEMNDIIATMQNIERNSGSRFRGQPFDYRALKKRSHCSDKVDEICLSEYVNGDTIGTLHCRHEYHATCI